MALFDDAKHRITRDIMADRKVQIVALGEQGDGTSEVALAHMIATGEARTSEYPTRTAPTIVCG
jgi:hypothetical protein